MLSAAAHLSKLLINKLDLAFTMGRVFGLLPVLIMSRQISDPNMLAQQVSDYQVAMFLATLVLYGGPQVYLVKRGIERKIFVWHMAVSATLFAAGIVTMQLAGWNTGLIMPFVFLVLFRSYYLLYASYLRTEPGVTSYVLLAIALVTLAIFAATLSYVVAVFVSLTLTGALTVHLGYVNRRFVLVALRRYFSILRRNFGYFVTFLLQQTYTQITLAFYAFFAVGTQYLMATHLVYIYSISFILHGILFRISLSKMSYQKRASAIRSTLMQSIFISLLLGILAAVAVIIFFEPIEMFIFGQSFLSFPTAVILGGMIVLNSTNFGWSALFLSYKRPFQLAAIAIVSTGIVMCGITLTAAIGLENGLTYAMLTGLCVQAVLRTVLGMKLLRQHIST